MKIITAIIIVICFHLSLSAQSDLRIIWDENHSSIANAENLLSIHQAIYQFSNQYLKTTYWDESSFKGKALGIGYRFTKTILFDYQNLNLEWVTSFSINFGVEGLRCISPFQNRFS
jgi:hypothetical protein